MNGFAPANDAYELQLKPRKAKLNLFITLISVYRHLQGLKAYMDMDKDSKTKKKATQK